VKLSLRIVGLVGGVLGAATAGLTVAGVARHSRRRQAALTGAGGDELGQLPPDHTRTVAADDGVPLSVEEVDPADGGKPELTVVLVHGFALSRLCWHYQRRGLAELTQPRVRQVLFDQRGHGRSGLPSEDSCTIEQLGCDLDVVVRSVAPTGPLELVGHSMGGMAIMALAEQRPELFAQRVRGVALIGTSAGEVGQSGLPRPVLSRYNPLARTLGDVAAWQPRLVEWARSAGDGVTRQMVRWLAFGEPPADSALTDFMVRMLAVTPVAVLAHFVPTLGTHNRYAALAGLRHCAVLVISGDQDELTPISHGERIAAELPHATFARVAGAGHMVMLERPDVVNEELVRLVRGCVTNSTGWRKRWMSR